MSVVAERLLAELVAEVRLIRRALEARNGTMRREPSAKDELLLKAIVDAVGSSCFTAAELVARATVEDAGLRYGLAAAGASSPAKLGKRLQALTRKCDGTNFHIERIGREDGGVIWSISTRPDDRLTATYMNRLASVCLRPSNGAREFED